MDLCYAFVASSILERPYTNRPTTIISRQRGDGNESTLRQKYLSLTRAICLKHSALMALNYDIYLNVFAVTQHTVRSGSELKREKIPSFRLLIATDNNIQFFSRKEIAFHLRKIEKYVKNTHLALDMC